MSCSFKYLKMFMQMANTVAAQSHAQRLKVGCVVVKSDRIIGMSYNGTPKGCDNCCEEKKFMDRDAGGWLSPEEIEKTWPHVDDNGNRFLLKTKDEVLHAEQNAIIQVAKSTESIEGATMFVTHAPCMQCAKMIIQSGIKYVYFDKEYRDTSGAEYMVKNGLFVIHLPTFTGDESPC